MTTGPDEPVLDEDTEGNKTQSLINPDLPKRIRSLLAEQPFCVLCTQGENQPYGSLIAYAFTEDMKHFYFTTAKPTRKFKLLKTCSHISLVVDSRCKFQEDLTRVEAVTITGRATQVKKGNKLHQGMRLLRDRHPYLIRFMEAESTALFRIDVVRYIHVTRFQEVSQWIP
jgi:nitroimidazol reductase NimA-like FMN-containing flavoprotein (pyridoxamine 5'-phosphate oxidase superfamily)